MLTIYSGYNLAQKTENITFDINELQPQKEIIEIVTQFMESSKTLDDETLIVGISTANPIVIATIEAIAMEKNKIHNLKYVYITEDGKEHITPYQNIEDCERDYCPYSELMNLNERYCDAYYKQKRKDYEQLFSRA